MDLHCHFLPLTCFAINETHSLFFLIVTFRTKVIKLQHNLKSFRLSDLRNDYQLVAARSCFHNDFQEINLTLGKKILWIRNTTLEIYFVYLVSKDPASFFADMQLRMIIHIICHSTSCPTPHLFIDGNNDFQQVKIINKIPTV